MGRRTAGNLLRAIVLSVQSGVDGTRGRAPLILVKYDTTKEDRERTSRDLTSLNFLDTFRALDSYVRDTI